MNNEIVLNQDGEETALVKPENFGNGMAFLNPAEMPDLEAAEIGFNIQPESYEFKTEGETLRAIFNGFTTFNVKDQNNEGQYIAKKTAVLQTRHGIKINMGANIIRQLELVPVGSAIQITYKGEQKTNGGRKVKVYDVHMLNVPRANIPAPVVVETKPDPKPEAPTYTNTQRATEYWSLVYSAKWKFTEDEGHAHLKSCGNDFAAAISALVDPQF